MNRRALIGAGTLTGVLALTTLAVTTSAQTGAESALKDACTLLTNDEIGSALGTTVRSSRPRPVPDGSECLYHTRANLPITIVVSTGDPKDFDELRELFGPDAEPVSGIGTPRTSSTTNAST